VFTFWPIRKPTLSTKYHTYEAKDKKVIPIQGYVVIRSLKLNTSTSAKGPRVSERNPVAWLGYLVFCGEWGLAKARVVEWGFSLARMEKLMLCLGVISVVCTVHRLARFHIEPASSSPPYPFRSYPPPLPFVLGIDSRYIYIFWAHRSLDKTTQLSSTPLRGGGRYTLTEY